MAKSVRFASSHSGGTLLPGVWRREQTSSIYRCRRSLFATEEDGSSSRSGRRGSESARARDQGLTVIAVRRRGELSLQGAGPVCAVGTLTSSVQASRTRCVHGRFRSPFDDERAAVRAGGESDESGEPRTHVVGPGLVPVAAYSVRPAQVRRRRQPARSAPPARDQPRGSLIGACDGSHSPRSHGYVCLSATTHGRRHSCLRSIRAQAIQFARSLRSDGCDARRQSEAGAPITDHRGAGGDRHLSSSG